MIESLESAITRFGRQLRLAREARGYTQKQLGEMIGIDGNSVAILERGETGVRWKVMEEIFSKLGEPASYYFSDDRPPMPSPPIAPEKALEVLSDAIRTLGVLTSKLPDGVPSDFLNSLGKLKKNQLAATVSQVGSYLKKKDAKVGEPDSGIS